MSPASSSRRVLRLACLAATALCISVAPAARAETVKPRTIAVFPHDTKAFTEGLVLFEGKFFESTGLNGQSALRRVTIATGAIEKNLALDSTLFGEGLARVDRQLIQLTYKTGAAIVYDLDSFAEQKRFTYTGEGWGLCYDGTDLVMSNGSNKLVFRDPATFATRREVTVQQNGTTFDQLNELECVGSLVYVNVWQTDTILRVEKSTGNVLTQIDASGLLTADETKAADVLNGIAYDEATQHFYLTGKYWPKVFEVSFDFNPGSADAGVNDGGARDAAADTIIARDAVSDAITARDTAGPTDARADASDSATDVTNPPRDDASNDAPTPLSDAASTDGASTSPPSGGSPQKSCACRSSARATREFDASMASLTVAIALAALRRRHRRASTGSA